MPDLRQGCASGKSTEDTAPADALVLFGAMGDLAHMKIFITSSSNLRFRAAISRPEIPGDRPFGFRGKQARSAERFIHCLHINIASVFPRFHKGDVLAIGRKLRGRNFWVAEDHIAINELRGAIRFVCLCGGEGREQENTHQDESEFHNAAVPFC